MREIVFKNITSADYKKRDICLSEIVERKGVICKSERQYHYIVKNIGKFDGMKDLEIISKNANPRNIAIIKRCDSKLGEEAFICDVKGSFYFVNKGYLYSVLFNQSFELDFISLKK